MDYVPATAVRWIAENLKNALLLNVVLAVFNMLPLPPLDGGRIAVGVLPNALALPLARLEPYGLPILIGALFILPLLCAQLGLDLYFISHLIVSSTNRIIEIILRLPGNIYHSAAATMATSRSTQKVGDTPVPRLAPLDTSSSSAHPAAHSADFASRSTI